MKYGIGIVVALLIVGGFFVLSKPASESSQPANAQETSQQASTPALSMQTIESDVAKGGQLIDVRTAEEYAAGHISGAEILPLQSIQAGTLPSAAKDQPVYVYCRSGNRSADATQLLKSAGYQNVIDLGAMTDVQQLGGQVVSS